MKRKINYLVIFLITFLCFGIHAAALTCTYQGVDDDVIWIKFDIELDTTLNVWSTNPDFTNYNDENGKKYHLIDANREGNEDDISSIIASGKCPAFAQINTTDNNKYLVLYDDIYNLNNNSTLLTDIRFELRNIQTTKFYFKDNKEDINNLKITTTSDYIANTDEMDIIKLAGYKIPNRMFETTGYIQSGWYVQNANGQWLCGGNNINDKFYGECLKSDRVTITFGDIVDFPIDGSETHLLARWDLAITLNPKSINELNLGKEECINHRFVWNEGGGLYDKYSYCNVDNLRFIMCGDAHDIPIQVPELISMAINLLKIATPIILIVVGIITLVKATMASKEDEIKKAQQSLVKKVIAAVMIFMIISIVQFVVTKVADKDDQKSITSCMACFIDNKCSKPYFKTNVGGKYYCASIYQPNSPTLCEGFYSGNEMQYKN